MIRSPKYRTAPPNKSEINVVNPGNSAKTVFSDKSDLFFNTGAVRCVRVLRAQPSDRVSQLRCWQGERSSDAKGRQYACNCALMICTAAHTIESRLTAVHKLCCVCVDALLYCLCN